MSEWTSKEELAKELKITPDELNRTLAQLIDSKFVEEKNGKYKVNNQDGKAYSRINNLLDSINDRHTKEKYYPYIRHGYLHLKHKFKEKGNYPKEVVELSKDVGYDLNSIDSSDMLNDANLFDLDQKTKWILKMTNNEIFKRNKPYDKIVLDCDLELDNKWFKGFLIIDKLCWTYWGNRDGFCDNALMFEAFNPDQTQIEKYFQDKISKSTIKKLKVFICNFFDFINNPEVRVIRFVRSEKNKQRRIKAGKEPLPSTHKIRLSGTLKTYYEQLEVSDRTLNYRFWVRGHFMRFWNKKKYNNLYKRLVINDLPTEYYVDDKIRNNDRIIMRWIKPFIKGEGVLITNRYEVKK